MELTSKIAPPQYTNPSSQSSASQSCASQSWVSAAMAYVAFGETITAIQVAGFFVTAIGVALVQRKSGKA